MSLRWGSAVSVVVAIGLGAAGCASGKSVPKPGPFSGKADQIVKDLGTSAYTDVSASFDQTMKTQLPQAALQNAWTSYQQLLGSYKSHSAPASVMKGQLDVERVPVTMANAKGEVRITFHPDGTVAGLYFLKADAPAP